MPLPPLSPGFDVACTAHVFGLRVALYSQVYGFVVALGWLLGGSGLRSICLVYGSVVALGGFLPYQELEDSRRDGADARRNPLGGEFLNRCSYVSYLPWLRHGCAVVATRTDPRAAGEVEMGNTTLSPWSGI